MPRTRIKICGICRPEDGVIAGQLGVDAIGIIRVPGTPRYVELPDARAIVKALPPFVTPVLLYVNADAKQMWADLSQLGRAAMVQLNGEESPDVVFATLPPAGVIKAVRVGADLPAMLAAWKNAAAVVLETPGQVGGSGIANDWATVARHRAAGVFEHTAPLMAAGGLMPDTVGEVVRAIRPYAVDVSSGVERVKRQKDAELMARFIDAVRAADADLVGS